MTQEEMCNTNKINTKYTNLLTSSTVLADGCVKWKLLSDILSLSLRMLESESLVSSGDNSDKNAPLNIYVSSIAQYTLCIASA